MTETVKTKHNLAKNKKYMLVRYGRMGHLGLFEHNETHIPKTPTRLVVKTERGLELGHLVGQLAHYKHGQLKLSESELQKYCRESEIEMSTKPAGSVIRLASHEDISEEKHLEKIARDEMKQCKDFVKELDLPMKIVDVEHIFGGERVIFYFLAEKRIDFRKLVKNLAQEYQTRIEMRQIGSRDEAKLLCDVETCGRECCCKQFLRVLKPVNMRMAKMQKATLDPSKISGYCGRLKCCLRYEDNTYSQLKKNLPKRGTKVKTPDGLGKVLETQILTQLVLIGLESGERTSLPVDEIEILPKDENSKAPVQNNKTHDETENKDKNNKAPVQENENHDDIENKDKNNSEEKNQEDSQNNM